MSEHEDTGWVSAEAEGQTGSFPTSNEDLLAGTGSIPLAASSTGAMARASFEGGQSGSQSDVSFATPSAQPAPRYVRKRTPHVSQGTLNDLGDESTPSVTYTHDSNISIGGTTPLSGMAYRRARSRIARVNNTRYGQYLEIPKGRRTIFASRERARRRNSVLALFAVIILLAIAAILLWDMMQGVMD